MIIEKQNKELIKQVPESNKVQVDEVTGVLKRNSSESKMSADTGSYKRWNVLLLYR